MILSGLNGVVGLWLAAWAMGNLGKAGYGASFEGMVGVSIRLGGIPSCPDLEFPAVTVPYDSCDVGTVINQTRDGVQDVPLYPGDRYHQDSFSYIPGQRLSRCTCPGEDHPGPTHDDGTFVGRSTPEIDVFEATTENDLGTISQSAQWVPFIVGYGWFNMTENFPNPEITELDLYTGGCAFSVLKS